MFRNLLLLVTGLAAGLLAGGCAHYRLGTGAAPDFHTLYISPVRNDSNLPQAAATVSAQLRDEFLRDGRVTLVSSPAEADATLTVVLTAYGRSVLTTQPGDSGLARKFGLALDATATLQDNTAGRKLFEQRPLHAERESFTDSGQLQSEYQAVPLLAGDLAKAAAHAVLDRW